MKLSWGSDRPWTSLSPLGEVKLGEMDNIHSGRYQGKSCYSGRARICLYQKQKAYSEKSLSDVKESFSNGDI